MSGPSGWSDRRSVVVVETYEKEDKVRERRVDLKEALGEDLKLSSLSEFLGPADVLGLRVLDIWGAEEPASAWVWAPQSPSAQRITAGKKPDQPSYRDAQLLDLLPRMTGDVTAEVVAEETRDGENLAVVDVDVGERDWPYGKTFRVWIGIEDERIRKLEVRGKHGEVRRRVRVLEWGEAEARAIATRVEIESPSSGQRVIVARSGVEFDRGIPEEVFRVRDPSEAR